MSASLGLVQAIMAYLLVQQMLTGSFAPFRCCYLNLVSFQVHCINS